MPQLHPRLCELLAAIYKGIENYPLNDNWELGDEALGVHLNEMLECIARIGYGVDDVLQHLNPFVRALFTEHIENNNIPMLANHAYNLLEFVDRWLDNVPLPDALNDLDDNKHNQDLSYLTYINGGQDSQVTRDQGEDLTQYAYNMFMDTEANRPSDACNDRGDSPALTEQGDGLPQDYFQAAYNLFIDREADNHFTIGSASASDKDARLHIRGGADWIITMDESTASDADFAEELSRQGDPNWTFIMDAETNSEAGSEQDNQVQRENNWIFTMDACSDACSLSDYEHQGTDYNGDDEEDQNEIIYNAAPCSPYGDYPQTPHPSELCFRSDDVPLFHPTPQHAPYGNYHPSPRFLYQDDVMKDVLPRDMVVGWDTFVPHNMNVLLKPFVPQEPLIHQNGLDRPVWIAQDTVVPEKALVPQNFLPAQDMYVWGQGDYIPFFFPNTFIFGYGCYFPFTFYYPYPYPP